MKKLLTVLLVAVLLASIFAGCTNGTPSASSPAQSSVANVSAPDVSAPAETPAIDRTKTLVVGLDDQFPPMGFRNQAGDIVGFDVDLAKEVGKRLGLEVVLQPINWSAKEMELDGGKVDVLWNGLTITQARKDSMLLTAPYLKNAQIIVVKKDSDIADKKGLSGKIVALQNASSAEDAFSNPSNGIVDLVKEKVGYDDNVMALNDLEIGRVDAVILDKVVAEYYLNLKPGVYKVLADELAEEEFGIAFKKGNTELYDKACAALSAMVADGTAEKISKEWFGENRVIYK